MQGRSPQTLLFNFPLLIELILGSIQNIQINHKHQNLNDVFFIKSKGPILCLQIIKFWFLISWGHEMLPSAPPSSAQEEQKTWTLSVFKIVLHSLETLILILLFLTKTGWKGLLWLSKHVQVIHALLVWEEGSGQEDPTAAATGEDHWGSSEFWEGTVTDKEEELQWLQWELLTCYSLINVLRAKRYRLE